MRWFLLLACVFLICGCSDPAKELPGLWSNGQQGRALDITPNGMYADVYLESLVTLKSWELEDGDLLLTDISSEPTDQSTQQEFRFKDEGLEFPLEKGRHLRFIREGQDRTPVADLVGLWGRETKTYRKEFIEFTPWQTVIWTRWDGDAGSQSLVSGWSSYAKTVDGKLLFHGTLENGKWLQWTRKISYSRSASGITLSFPKPIGKKTFTSATAADFRAAAKLRH